MPNIDRPSSLPTRRTFVAGASAALASLPLLARPALASVDEALKAIAAFTGGATPQQGKITIGAPEIAENGNTVPIVLDVDSPMTEQSYVKSIVVIADGNPLPGVAGFNLTPANGKAHVEFRIRLAQTQHLIAVAQLSDGSFWTASRSIKVTIGGCGG